MDLDRVTIGNAPPHDLNVVVEIPLRGMPPVKYELDKESGAMMVSRFLHTAMYYPVNYGFLPHTLAEDGDPADVCVVGQTPVIPGAVLRSRPIGVLVMEDEEGQDEKILAVPHATLHPFYADVEEYGDLPPILRDQIKHFFSHYKDLEEGKWVSVSDWRGVDEAHRLINESVERYRRES